MTSRAERAEAAENELASGLADSAQRRILAEARAEKAEAENKRLRESQEHLLHGICDALAEGTPTGLILRALLKGTEHEGHR